MNLATGRILALGWGVGGAGLTALGSALSITELVFPGLALAAVGIGLALYLTRLQDLDRHGGDGGNKP